MLELGCGKPHTLDICLTGHDAEKEFIDQILAVTDLATEMVKLKHPFDTGSPGAQRHRLLIPLWSAATGQPRRWLGGVLATHCFHNLEAPPALPPWVM